MEVLVVVALIGMVFSSFLLLQESIIKSFRKAQDRQVNMIELNNAKSLIWPIFGGRFLDRDEKIKEVLNGLKEGLPVKYKIEKMKKDSILDGIPQVDIASLTVCDPLDSSLVKDSTSFFVYNLRSDSEKEK